MARILLIMGVAGSGKTTIGRLFAARSGWTFLDADDFHPPANIGKMEAGIPLNDADREPWLAAMAAELHRLANAGQSAVLACSALKEKYRSVLRDSLDGFSVAYLAGPYELIAERISSRSGHFMPKTLLQSQYDDLEEPQDSIRLDASLPPDRLVDTLCRSLVIK